MTDLISVQTAGHVAVVEMHRPPNNFFDETLLCELAEALLALNDDREVRSVVMCSEGKHFCAGAQLSGMTAEGIRRVYRQALRLFTARRPVVAAVQGAAVGGGLGLALAADFRVAVPESRFAANFARLGFHQGFGLSVTLPALVGQQRALELLLTGRDVSGSEALEIGLCDRLTPFRPARSGAHAGRGDRPVGTAFHRLDPRHHAPVPGRRRRHGARHGGPSTGGLAAHSGLPRGDRGRPGPPRSGLHRSMRGIPMPHARAI